MAAILTVQGGIIMQNRQIDGHGLYLSLLAGLAVLCLAAALVCCFFLGKEERHRF